MRALVCLPLTSQPISVFIISLSFRHRNAQRKIRSQTLLLDVQQRGPRVQDRTSLPQTLQYKPTLMYTYFSSQAKLNTEVEDLRQKAAQRQAARQAEEEHQADVSMEPLSGEGIAV